MVDKKVIEITEFHTHTLPYFQDIWRRAKENIGIYGIEHWNDTDKAKFKASDRTELNIPVLTQKVNSLLGFERENRTESTFYGVGEEDELNGEILTKLTRWSENANIPKYSFIKSDIFRDAIVPAYGALEIYVEEDETGRDVVRFKRIPYNNVLWDFNFTDFELQTASRMQKVRWVYVDQLMREYPKKKKELESTTYLGYQFDENDYIPVKNLDMYYRDFQEINGKMKYLCKEITDYSRVNKTVYEVIKVNLDFPGDDKYSFETKDEAKNFIDFALRPLGIKNYDDYFVIKPITKSRIEKTVVTGNMVLEDTVILEEDEFPIKILFSYFYDGKFWTPVDVSKDPQHYFDKVYAQIDKSISEGVKPSRILFPNALHPDMTIEEAEARLVRGEPIYGLDPSQDPFKIINAPPMLGAYLEILQLNQVILEDLHGGRNFQGLTENAGQSGVAIQSLQSAGAQMTLNFLESLQRFEDSVAKYVLRLILKHYNYEMTIRILGDQFTEKAMSALESSKYYKKSALETGVGFLRVNSKGQKPLADSVYDIVIKPVTSRRNEKDIKFQKLIQYAQITGNPIPPKLVGRMLDLEPTEIEELSRYAEEQKQLQLRQMQFDANMRLAEASRPDSNLLMAMSDVQQNANQNQNINQ